MLFPFIFGLLFVAFEVHQHIPGTNIIWLFVFFYFVPTITALARHRSPMAVALLNTTFGWTGVGWFVSMLWALA